MAEDRDPKAPHGRNSDGIPLAPYGLKADGVPRIDGRGRSAGVKAPTKKRAAAGTKKARTDKETRDALVGLADPLTMGLVAASKSGWVAKHIGQQQAMALAGDAVILEHYAGPLADVTMQFAETRPGMLSWLDHMDDAGPLIAAGILAFSIGKAFVSNHAQPDERLAKSGLMLVKMKAAQMADAIEEQARAMGLDTEDVPMPQAAAA